MKVHHGLPEKSEPLFRFFRIGEDRRDDYGNSDTAAEEERQYRAKHAEMALTPSHFIIFRRMPRIADQRTVLCRALRSDAPPNWQDSRVYRRQT